MKRKVEWLKKVAPTALVAILIVVLVAVAFLPSVRAVYTKDVAANVYSRSVDSEAMRVLETASALVGASDFKAKQSGQIKARVFGIPYTQNVSGTREVIDGVYSETAESKSALVKAALKKHSAQGGYDVCRGEYKKKRFVYAAPKHYDSAEFVASYGKPSTRLVRYETVGAVTEAVKKSDGEYCYSLDVKRATEYCANEIKTLLDIKKPPVYESISFTLYTDGVRPIKVVATEKFRVDKFGGINCTAHYEETFEFV